MFIHYDPEADYLEVRFGTVTTAYYTELGNDMFERRDEKTNQIKGYALFNMKKRKQIQDFEMVIPSE